MTGHCAAIGCVTEVFCPRAWDRWRVLNRGVTGHCAVIGRVTACVGLFVPAHGEIGRMVFFARGFILGIRGGRCGGFPPHRG